MYATGALRRENLEEAALAWLNRLPEPDADADDHAQELRDLGVPEEEIEAAREHAAALQGEAEPDEVVVWAENWNIVEAFTHCQWRKQVVLTGMGAVTTFDCIEASELLSVCELLAIAPAGRRDVLWGVQVMAATALPHLNEQR